MLSFAPSCERKFITRPSLEEQKTFLGIYRTRDGKVGKNERKHVRYSGVTLVYYNLSLVDSLISSDSR